mmetsp:Transcript_47144/g.93824  ORF Transcript_47144/g.93824 Transcript_47144/m.93824 type:complete len:703 (+) Transcript_47144:3-2111(+)
MIEEAWSVRGTPPAEEQTNPGSVAQRRYGTIPLLHEVGVRRVSSAPARLGEAAPARRHRYPSRRERARKKKRLTKVQALWRGRQSRAAYRRSRRAAIQIQALWRCCRHRAVWQRTRRCCQIPPTRTRGSSPSTGMELRLAPTRLLFPAVAQVLYGAFIIRAVGVMCLQVISMSMAWNAIQGALSGHYLQSFVFLHLFNDLVNRMCGFCGASCQFPSEHGLHGHDDKPGPDSGPSGCSPGAAPGAHDAGASHTSGSTTAGASGSHGAWQPSNLSCNCVQQKVEVTTHSLSSFVSQPGTIGTGSDGLGHWTPLRLHSSGACSSHDSINSAVPVQHMSSAPTPFNHSIRFEALPNRHTETYHNLCSQSPQSHHEASRSKRPVALSCVNTSDTLRSSTGQRQALPCNALLVGIDTYATRRHLRGCVNDVRSLAPELSCLGFDCTVCIDCTYAELARTCAEFVRCTEQLVGEAPAGSCLAMLMFFALHARDKLIVECSDGEFLDLSKALIRPLNNLLSVRHDVQVVLIFISDACRVGPTPGDGNSECMEASSSPFANVLSDDRRVMSRIKNRQFASAVNWVFLYSCDPGRVAQETCHAESDEAHGVFTRHLLKHLPRLPSMNIYEWFVCVSEGVSEETRYRQRPWMNARLTFDFRLGNHETPTRALARTEIDEEEAFTQHESEQEESGILARLCRCLARTLRLRRPH